MRKAQGMKIARIVLWVMLAFIFARGVISVVQDGENEASVDFQQYQNAVMQSQTRTAQLLPFAEDFAREYLTYSAGGEQDYIERLSKFAPASLFSSIRLGNASAEALFATAYRHEAYSQAQEDVWVRLQVRYTTKERNSETEEIVEVRQVKETTLKIPIACIGESFIVEDLPAFVADERKASSYASSGYTAPGADRDTQNAVREALESFFKAYYTEDQSVVKYYLTADAQQEDFLSLGGRVAFERITNCTVYLPSEDENILLAIVALEVEDANGMLVPQHLHVELLQQDGQYRIRSIDTRIKNI